MSELAKARKVFDVIEAFPVAVKIGAWKTAVLLGKLELVLFATKNMVNEGFDRWFVENVNPVLWEVNPKFAGDFANIVENLASNPEYVVGALGIVLGLFALSGAANAVAIGVHLSREGYIASKGGIN